MNSAPELILASQSSYRKELLDRLHLPFKQVASNVDEDGEKQKGLKPLVLAKALAFKKAQSVLMQFPNAIVIGSDQVATLDGQVLGKPGSPEKALNQLSQLSGKTHSLITSVCVMSLERSVEFQNITNLSMKVLAKGRLENYISIDQPFDCAGSYKIEGLGISLFEKIDTTAFTSIIGLPLIQLTQALEQFDIQVP